MREDLEKPQVKPTPKDKAALVDEKAEANLEQLRHRQQKTLFCVCVAFIIGYPAVTIAIAYFAADWHFKVALIASNAFVTLGTLVATIRAVYGSGKEPAPSDFEADRAVRLVSAVAESLKK